MNRTLAIIKPDTVSHPVILKVNFFHNGFVNLFISLLQKVGDIIIDAGFNINRACTVKLTHAQAEQLYSAHVGLFF